MIRFKLKEAIAKREFVEARRITLGDVAAHTGVHRVTLSKIANGRGYNAGVDNVNRLCAYFSCQPGDIMEYVPHPLDLAPLAARADTVEKAIVPTASQKRPKAVPNAKRKGRP